MATTPETLPWDPEFVIPETQDWTIVTPIQIRDYVNFCIDMWEAENSKDAFLWEAYLAAFGNCPINTFQNMPHQTKSKLRNYLRKNGIYIPLIPRTSAYQALYDAAQETNQPTWPEDELLMQIQHPDGLTSRLNTTWAREHGKQPLPRTPNEPILEPHTPAHNRQPPAAQPFMTPSTTHVAQPGSRRSIRWQRDEPVASTEELRSHQRDSLTPTPIHQHEHGLAEAEGLYRIPSPGLTQYTRELTVLSKLYRDDMKYSGFGDNFQRKIGIFEDICFKAGIPDDGKQLALSFMLKDAALDFYYDSVSRIRPPFDRACEMITNYFEGPEWQQGVKNEWNTTTLTTTIAKNPDKSTAECLTIMLRTLSALQLGLRDNQRDVETLRDKVLDACRGIPATAAACSNPAQQFGALINQLKASILTYESIPGAKHSHQYAAEDNMVDELFTDRRFHRRDNWTRKRYNGRRDTHQGDKPVSASRPFRCFVCGKPDCRSDRHTRDEREAAWKKYRAEVTPRLSQRLDNKARQFITAYEGPTSDREEDDMDTILQQIIDADLQDKEDVSFLTERGPISLDEAQDIYHSLCVNSTYHAITHSLPNSDYDPGRGHYSNRQFLGILIDTGAAKHSTCGYGQFQALQSLVSIGLNRQAPCHGFRFGIGNTTSLGTTNIPLPIGNVTFYVIKADTPFLLSLADMTRLEVYLNNVSRELVRDRPKPQTWPVIEHRGHMFLHWQNTAIPTTAYPSELDVPQLLQKDETWLQMPLTDKELRHLHRRFGHPSVRKLLDMLERAGYDDIPAKTIKSITELCHLCQKHSTAPGRFKFTIRNSDAIQFNHTILVDIMYIDGAPVLHVVDDATSFQAARWLPDIATRTVWNALRNCWLDVYIGPPDYIVTDAGKNLTSKEFQNNASLVGTTANAVPVEAHWSIGKVERYHAILRRAYAVIAAEAGDLDQATTLQMAVKAINDTAGPKGLVPTLLVFGALPRISQHDAPTPTLATRAQAIQKAMAEVAKLHAQRSIRDALHTRNGPDTQPMHDLPIGSKVLVWREGSTGRSGAWTGPHILLSVTGETCNIQLDRSHSTPAAFRTTQVKPYLEVDAEDHDQPAASTANPPANPPPTPDTNITQKPADEPDRRNPARQRRLPYNLAGADVTLYLHDHNETPQDFDVFAYTRQAPFTESRAAEINGLIEKGVFEIVPLSAVPAGTRLFTSRFVDQIKAPGTPKEHEKSRLVVRAYQDHEKERVLVQSPTIQRASQRLILALAATLRYGLYLRDITQAYTQSTTTLNRPFYVRPPPSLGLSDDVVLHIIKPLYGIPEAGNHWFRTYHGHYTSRLRMQPSTYDPCLLHQTGDTFGVLGLQTDDTIGLFSPEFAQEEEEQIQAAGFASKPREQLTTATPLQFNGGLIQLLTEGVITLTQEQHCKELRTVTEQTQELKDSRGKTKQLSPREQYVSLRAKGAYIATMCQPEAAYDLSVAAQTTDLDSDAVKALNKRLQWQLENATRGLKYAPLTTELELIVFTDASFANNRDLSSQIGYVIVLADKTGKANILHWSSIKCKRVTRSVLGAELYALAHGFDMGTSIKLTLDAILPSRAPIPLVLCTDSKSLFDCIVKLGTTQEKRLMIDVMCLRQSYERREIAECRWIEGSLNPADAMTKKAPCAALTRLLDTNSISITPKEWVERPQL